MSRRSRWPHCVGMLWVIAVRSRLPDPLGEHDHGVAVEAESWADAALSIADDPDWEVDWPPPLGAIDLDL